MAKLISVSAWVTPTEGQLLSNAGVPVTGQRLINVDNIQGVKAAPSGGAFNINGANTAIDYSYNVANTLQNGSFIVAESVAAILAAASA